MHPKFKGKGAPKPPKRDSQSAVVAQQLQGALQLHVSGKLSEARTIYEEVLLQNPGHFDCLHLLGIACYQSKELQRAVDLIGKAIQIQPDNAAFYSNRGLALKDLRRLEDALAHHEKAISLKPEFVEAHNNRGTVLIELGRLDEAVASFDAAIQLKPDYAEAHFNRGVALGALKQLHAALGSFDKAIAIRPDYADAFYNRGLALTELRQLDDAVVCFDRATALNPRHIQAYNNRGSVLADLGHKEAALASYNRAIELHPAFASAYYNRGIVLQSLGRFEDSTQSFRQAITLEPKNANAYNNLGLVFTDMCRYEEAVASFDQAIVIRPAYAHAFNNRGTALNGLKRFADAIASYDMALQIDPAYAKAHYNRGLAFYGRKQLTAAIECYDKALSIAPALAEAHNNRGNALLELRQLDAAIESYSQALTLRPDYEYVYGIRAHARMLQCSWDCFDADIKQLTEQVRNSIKASTPLPLLALVDAPAVHKRAAEILVADMYAKFDTARPLAQRPPHNKIRIGYYSADFRNHPVSHLAIGLFEAHDKLKFEVIGFSFGPPIQDEMRTRVAAAFDQFIDAGAMSDSEVAQRSREMGIDIAIDLMGFTQDSRPGVFAARCAPVQVNYLGYPGTTGAPFMDYIVADRIVITDHQLNHYTEKIARLPHCFLPNDAGRVISDKPFTRADFGLPEAAFVFCCFNNNYKITPPTFDSWMRILSQVPSSVLWLRDDAAVAVANLRREAQARGIDPARLHFAGRVPEVADHLARHRLADLFLDTVPYNAHTSAADALWTGLPVLTLMGNSFASRVAGSLLNALGVEELITHTPEQYEALAIALATDPEKLQQVKQTLQANLPISPLFSTKAYTAQLEQFFETMALRAQNGLAPDHIL